MCWFPRVPSARTACLRDCRADSSATEVTLIGVTDDDGRRVTSDAVALRPDTSFVEEMSFRSNNLPTATDTAGNSFFAFQASVMRPRAERAELQRFPVSVAVGVDAPLRLVIASHVNHGKSTLVGPLLGR